MRNRTLLLALLRCTLSTAQLFTNSGAAITVQSGAQLTVEGEVRNDGNGFMDNSGTIELSGHWTNDANNDCFGNSEGTVVLNGNAQSVQGSMYTQFYHLHLNGNVVVLQQDAYVGGSAATARSGVLALNSADLMLNEHYLSMSNPTPGAITRTTGTIISESAPPAAYGRFNWWLGTALPGVYTIPFGNAGTGSYLPVTIGIGSPSTDPFFAMVFATYPTDPYATPNNRPLPIGVPVLTSVAGAENAPYVVDRFWAISVGETNSYPTATLALTYRESEWNTGTNSIVEPALQAQRFDGAVWSQPPVGIDDPLLNTVSTPLTDALDGTWALVQAESPLPVELLSFTARADGAAVRCAWSTASEVGSDRFTVERSADGNTFLAIGDVAGAGTSYVEHAYDFVDPAPYRGVSYYRLRQTDLDGTEQWSQAVAVRFDMDPVDLEVWPNPCHSQLTIRGATADDVITLMDATGREVKRVGADPFSIDLSGLAEGQYLLTATSPYRQRSVRVSVSY